VSATVIGSTGSVEQGKSRTYSKEQGEIRVRTFDGPSGVVEALFDTYKSDAQQNGNISGMQFNDRRGIGRLVVNVRDPDGTNVQTAPGSGQTRVYELFANIVYKPMESADYFSALSASSIVMIQSAVVAGKALTLADKEKELYELLSRGNTEHVGYEYVLRETIPSTLNSAVTASFTGVGTVQTPPAYATTLIGSIPAGEWLKQAPMVQSLGKGRWAISQEWWWSEHWSIVYGGTLTYA